MGSLTVCMLCIVSYTTAPHKSTLIQHVQSLTSSDSDDPNPLQFWFNSIQDELTFHHQIHRIANYYVADKAHVDVISDDNEIYFPFHLSNFELDEPSSIAHHLIDIIYEWYEYQVFHNLSQDLKIQLKQVAKLKQSLIQIDQQPSLHSFQDVQRSLRNVFPARKQQNYALFYQFLYYEPFIEFISRGTLIIESILGEGSQSIVYKVQSLTSMEKLFFAIKIYKRYDYNPECLTEERIMNHINHYGYLIPVPRLIPQIYGVSINCIQHNAILMQYIDTVSKKVQFSPENAIDMFQQLKSAVIELGIMGISHDDINDNNIMMDVNNKYWLIDFGHSSIILSDEIENTSIIGTWMFYSPALFDLNMYLLTSNQINDVALDVGVMKRLIIDGNMYSLQATILHRLSMKTGHFTRKMLQISQTIDEIWLNTRGITDARKFQLMHSYFKRIWKARSNLACYILRKYSYNPLLNHVFSLLMDSCLEDDADLFDSDGSDTKPLIKRQRDIDSASMSSNGKTRCCCIIC